MLTSLWRTCKIVHDAIPTKMCSFHFNGGLFSWVISVRLIPERLTIKNVIKESSFRGTRHSYENDVLDSISINIFCGGPGPVSCGTCFQRLSMTEVSVFFSIRFRFAFCYQHGGAMSNFNVLLFTSFALIHFKCQIPLTQAAPRDSFSEPQGVWKEKTIESRASGYI